MKTIEDVIAAIREGFVVTVETILDDDGYPPAMVCVMVGDERIDEDENPELYYGLLFADEDARFVVTKVRDGWYRIVETITLFEEI